jgi:lysozyme
VKAKAGIASLVVVLVAAPFVAVQEGLILKTYADPIGIPTACGGETDAAITMRQRFTRDECVAVMGASLLQHAQRLEECVSVPVTEGQAAALLSWAYNVGTGAACGSTLVRKLNAGAPPSEWCAELSRWNKAGGRVLPGLVKRRAAERAMCEGKP